MKLALCDKTIGEVAEYLLMAASVLIAAQSASGSVVAESVDCISSRSLCRYNGSTESKEEN